MSRKEILQHVELWVYMCALENFPEATVHSWTLGQWKEFYLRIQKK